MSEYEDLVRSLRSCANGRKHISGNKKPFCGLNCISFSEVPNCYDNLLNRTADAIEELVTELVTMKQDSHKWISVEERLPELGVYVWGYVVPEDDDEDEEYSNYLIIRRVDNTHSFQFAGREKQLRHAYQWEDREGDIYDPEEVTHWMPLPEPPKEDKP